MTSLQCLPPKERRASKKVRYTCACGCGTEFYRYKCKSRGKQQFVNAKHQRKLQAHERLVRCCGNFLPLVTRYFHESVEARYRSPRHVKFAIPPFFRYLCEADVSHLGEITPERIRAFVKWGQDHAKSATRDLSALRTFFSWCRLQDLYHKTNPVIPSIHVPPRNKNRYGRPYTQDEIHEFRSHLTANGSVRTRAVFELALESGLRCGEICRLKLTDVDLEAKSITVDLPNKGMRQRRTMIYSAACVAALEEWLRERSTDCGHHAFFHNSVARPCVTDMLVAEFGRTFKTICGTDFPKGQQDRRFSLHRLRHTFASRLASSGAEPNTLQELCGWQSTQTALTYVSIDPASLACSYAETFGRDAVLESSTLLSDEEFLASLEARV